MPLCERLTADIAGELAFGQPLHTQTETTNRVVPRAMLSMNFLVSLFMTWPTLSTTWPLLRRLNQRNGAVFSTVVCQIITAHMKLPQDAKHDFYSICVDSTCSEEEGLGQSELWAEAIFMLPAEPFVADGHVTPADITVGVNSYCLMHKEAYFTDTSSFKLEIWLAPEEDGEHDASGGKEQGQEASRATMRKANCLGKGMAYLEISLTLAKTLWRFDFEKAPGELGRVDEGHPGIKDHSRSRAARDVPISSSQTLRLPVHRIVFFDPQIRAGRPTRREEDSSNSMSKSTTYLRTRVIVPYHMNKTIRGIGGAFANEILTEHGTYGPLDDFVMIGKFASYVIRTQRMDTITRTILYCLGCDDKIIFDSMYTVKHHVIPENIITKQNPSCSEPTPTNPAHKNPLEAAKMRNHQGQVMFGSSHLLLFINSRLSRSTNQASRGIMIDGTNIGSTASESE
ncbi:cytochrome P450 [Apiospora arundinis]|uniref:Cytochrome P450 n=1 Tax=Apiospora arundinis TaxID=335852 RepID=A0ABR2J402_9PEZI